ncbi:MAG: DUF3858 domain-containing protein [Saprospiraceae bacterium]
MKRFYFLLILYLPSFTIGQKDPSVKIHQSTHAYTIKSLTDMDESVTKNFTIYNSASISEATIVIPYDKGSKIVNAEITYFNAAGLVLKKVKLKDFGDHVLNDGFSVFTDNRFKYCANQYDQLPLRIEYNYTIHHKSTLDIAPWYPQTDYNEVVEHAEFDIKSELVDIIEYKEIRFHGQSNFTPGNWHWSIDSIVSLSNEDFSPDFSDLVPIILIRSNKLIYEQYHSEFKTWKEYGVWVNQLLKDRDQLVSDDIQKINQLVEHASTDDEKISILYSFLQNNMRYVSIQLGIGGLQPMKASEVSNTGYGDCKALSNYMKAILKVVGINSFYTEIGAGERKIKYPDFASFYQTNHVILTVPQQSETLFLECTSPFFPPGYIGNMSADRYALQVLPDGGNLIKTPQYAENTNRRIVSSSIQIIPGEKTVMDIYSLFSGIYFERFADFHIKNLKEQEKIIVNKNTYADCLIDSFTFTRQAQKPIFELIEHISSNKFVTFAGTRIFIPLSLIQRYKPRYASKDSDRVHDIVITASTSQVDTLTIEIPKDYTVESYPKDVELTNSFGKCIFKIEMSSDKLKIINQFVLLKNTLPPSYFSELKQLLDTCYKSIQSKIVLKKIGP